MVLKLFLSPQECYVHNLLRVTTYLPSLRRDILELIFNKMLNLDVRCENLVRVQRLWQSEEVEEFSAETWFLDLTSDCWAVVAGGRIQVWHRRRWRARRWEPESERGGTLWHGSHEAVFANALLLFYSWNASLTVCVRVLFTQDEDMPTADAPSALVTAHPVAERLDSLMVVLMAYVKDASHLNGSSKTQQ